MLNEHEGIDLNARCHFPKGTRYAFAVLSLLALLLITYGNSLHGEWHFDDYPNIVENGNVHLKELSGQGIKQTFFFHGRFSRPLSYFSFALNYRFGGLDVFGYHLINLAIHFITTLFLFFFALRTFQLPAIGDRLAKHAFPAALLTAALWAISPVLVLAVSYIVQRMTSMAGMFFIMAMFFYLKGRTSPIPLKRGAFYTFFVVSSLAAFGSKENTAMLPLTVFFYDLFLIQGVKRETVIRSLKLAVIPAAAVVVLAVLYTDFSAIIAGYANREFSLTERLLTEFRVTILYLSLLIYPTPDRLTLLHDIEVSHSFLHPYSTLPALVLIVLLIAYALWSAKKKPLLSFCIVAFFLNHAIEGSIIPLELIYEHRNYIPSMFFFIALSSVLVQLFERLTYRRSLQYLLAAVVVFFLVMEGRTVSFRNEILRTEKTLWLDNVAKAPNISRTHSSLGMAFFEEGNYAAGLHEYGEALRIGRYGNKTQPAFDLGCLGNYYMKIEDNADRAISCYHEAMEHYGVTPDIYDGLAVAMLRKGNLQEAYENSIKALSLREDKASFHNNLAMILLKQGNLNGAKSEAKKALLLDPSSALPLGVLGEVYRVTGDYRKSASYWERYREKEERDFNALLALIEVYAQLGDKSRTVQAITRLLRLKGKQKIDDVIGDLNRRGNLLAYVPKRETIEAIINKDDTAGHLQKKAVCP